MELQILNMSYGMSFLVRGIFLGMRINIFKKSKKCYFKGGKKEKKGLRRNVLGAIAKNGAGLISSSLAPLRARLQRRPPPEQT